MISLDSIWPYLYGIILIFSLCCGSVIPIIYQFSPKCRHHPAQVFMIICLLEMIVCYQLFLDSIDFKKTIEFFNTYFYLYRIESLYIFDKFDMEFNDSICQINQYIILIAFLAQLNYYIVLTVDFIISLQRPFWNTKQKVIAYHFFVLISTAVIASLEWKSIDIMCKYQGAFGLIMEFPRYIIFQILILIFSLIASIYFGYRHMIRMKKINQQVLKNRRMLFQNHIILLITVLIMWSVKLIPWKAGQGDVESVDDFWLHLCFAILLLHPTIFLIIRLREPYFKDRAQLLLETLKCKRKWQDNYDLNYDEVFEDSQLPLIQIEQKSNQCEVVRNILTAITTIIESDINHVDGSSFKQKNVQKLNYFKHQVNCNNDSTRQTLIWQNELILNSQITEYAPFVFQKIRENKTQIQQSLRLDLNEKQIQDTQETMGRSGSLIFYSYDDSLILKTIQYSELEFFLESIKIHIVVLPHYYEHIEEQKSLISTVYGIFTVQIEGFQQIHLMMMENIFQHMTKKRIIYDLKGSLVDRQTQCGPDQIEEISHSLVTYKPSDFVLKDVNFIQSIDLFIHLKEVSRDQLYNILKKDLKFLQKHQIMDYSLLLAVSTEKMKTNKRIFTNKKKTYCFGLIDFTQKFTLTKKLEFYYKIYLGRKGQQISCLNPKQYYQRLLKFINSILIINDNI